MEDMRKKYWEKIQRTAYLENIRMLFDCMQELNYRYRQRGAGRQRYTGYDGRGGLACRESIQADLERCVEAITGECLTDDAVFLHQHPLYSYFAFCQRLFLPDEKEWKKDSLVKAMGRELAPMLNYFNILQYLTEEGFAPEREKPEHHAALPYFYEDLCLSIREMARCHACFLLYHEEGELTELIARSGYVADGERGKLSNFEIKISQLDNIIKRYSDGAVSGDEPVKASDEPAFIMGEDIAEGIWTVRGVDRSEEKAADHTYLVMQLPYFREGRQEENDRNFYLLLDYKEAGGGFLEEKGKAAALKVLFLRNRLWEALRQDYAELIDRRFDCSYVKSVGESGCSCIMHISDVHMKDDNGWAAESMMCARLCAHIDGERDEHIRKARPIDLLAVTGDIVNASQHASEAQAKYRRAGALLQEIAAHLWGVSCGGSGLRIVPHDWKRRIMVVTGNHDYTAMSDVVVETGGRRIKNALPAGYSGGTMSKFTYYIEFLINFLDAPIDELLENDLNEIRNYKYLKLKVALLNTSSRANSLQNNKVEINREKVSRLMQRMSWHNGGKDWRHVVLMHHSPFYQIDYFADKYEPQKYCRGDGFRTYKNYRSLLERFISRKPDESGGAGAVSEQEEEWLRSIREEVSKPPKDPKFSRSEIKADMEVLADIWKKDRREWDEFSYHFLSKNKSLWESQKLDQAKFDEMCGMIIREGEKTTVLAGHEHKETYDRRGRTSVYLAARLYNPNRAGGSDPGTLLYLVVEPGDEDTDSFAQMHLISLSDGKAEWGICPCSKDAPGLEVCDRDRCPFLKPREV